MPRMRCYRASNEPVLEDKMKRRLITRILLALFSVVLTVYAVELALWCFDPARSLPVHNETVDGVRYNWGVPIVNNRRGFRDDEFEADGKPLLLVVGDSFTWGAGLWPEERWSNLVETAGYNVWNTAQSGWQMRDYLQVVKALPAEMKPDRIIVGYVVNDIHWDRRWARWRPCFVRCGLPRLGDRIARIDERGSCPSVTDVRDMAYAKENVHWLVFTRLLQQIKSLSDTSGCKPPIFASLAAPSSATPICRGWMEQAEQTASRMGFVTVTFWKELEKYSRSELELNACDRHPSALLNALYAKKILAVL